MVLFILGMGEIGERVWVSEPFESASKLRDTSAIAMVCLSKRGF